MWFLIGVAAGILVTILFTKFYARSWTIGVLKINLTDPDADMFKLNIDTDVESLPNHKIVILKVDSQK